MASFFEILCISDNNYYQAYPKETPNLGKNPSILTVVPPVAEAETYCAPKFKSKANPESPPPNTHWYPAKAPPEKAEKPTSSPELFSAEAEA